MRMRRIHRLMSSLFRNIKQRMSGSGAYSLISSTSDGNSKCVCANDLHCQRIEFLREFVTGHLPSLACLFLASARIAFPEGWSNYLITFFLLLLLVLGLLNLVEKTTIYASNVPDKSRFFTDLPSISQFPSWRLVTLRPTSVFSGLTLKCFLLLQSDDEKRATAPTIIFLHGNAGNIGHRLPLAKLLYDICGVNVFLLEYRGFGCSGGYPSELGLYADAMAALDYLTNECTEVDSNNIFLYGRSLGGAVAIELGTRADVVRGRIRGTIVENTFCSITDMGRLIGTNICGRFMDFLLPRCLVSNKFESLHKLQHRTPLLENQDRFVFLSSQQDELIPPTMMMKLAKAWAASRYSDINNETVSRGDGEEPGWVYDPTAFILNGKDGLVRFHEGGHGTTFLCDGFNDVFKKFTSVHSVVK